MHFYAGLLIGPFLLVAAISGGLYALSPQLEKVVHADLLRPPNTGTAPIPLARQVAAAEQVTTVANLVAVRPAPAGGTTRVIFDDGRFAESYRHAVFVDPGTGAILGQSSVYGTTGALPVRSWIDELHRSLHLGDVGRYYSELAASWLWVVTLGGVAMWLGRVRRTGKKPLTGRARTRTWHGLLGLWMAAGFLALSATGLTWSTFAGENVTQLREQLDWSTPSVSTTVVAAPVVTGGEHSSHGGGTPADTGTVDVTTIDAVWAAAHAAEVDSDQVEIGLPKGEGRTWTVTEVHRAYPTSVDVAAVDPVTLQVTDVVRFADYPFMAKMARWGVDLHMGTMFGLVNQIALTVLALGLAAMIVLGYRMWWQRRPVRGSRSLFGGPAPARGAWLKLPAWLIVVGVPLVFAVSWFLPLFGIPLLVFLLVDIAIGAFTRPVPPVPVSAESARSEPVTTA
ncbi:PepSY-associated TM helix domain-containing protein [Actinoplanes derwentensis]|uniref:PepSY-associated TM helix domain-containing protein n=1 Tax=Actinoplanes derwentensis TaxID=113562 RepID=UPI0022B2641D|nr:PepSY-associated TM helix domain-containing protein [Actinoplanes derwentensis]